MKILFTSTYYNNPAFIELQLKSLQLFLQHDFDFLVMDDADHDTKSLVNGGLATKEIEDECRRLGVKYRRVPQWVHANKNKGGLVPNGEPANHPTERHRACLHWILNNNQPLNWHNYDYVILAESDLLLRKPVDVIEIMNNGALQISGTGRQNYLVKKIEGQEWPEEWQGKREVIIDFYTMYLTIFNMQHRNYTNVGKMDISGICGTDTGGKTCLYLHDYVDPNHNEFIEISGNPKYQVDFFKVTHGKKYNGSFEDDAEFVHYRGGSNWDYQSMAYYWEKFYRMLRRYVPELYNAEKAKHTTSNLTSRDNEHTFFANEE